MHAYINVFTWPFQMTKTPNQILYEWFFPPMLEIPDHSRVYQHIISKQIIETYKFWINSLFAVF